MKHNNTHTTLSKHLYTILENNKNKRHISLELILNQLHERSYPSIIFIISLAFSFPISIPGLSTPFGLILAFLGLWIVLGKELWLPKWLRSRDLSYSAFEKIATKAIWLFSLLEKFVRPRLSCLSENRLWMIVNGILILVMSLLLSLPLPIPLTNILAAIPIVLISLGLLERDGIIIILGYFSCISSMIIFALIAFSITHLHDLIRHLFS